MKFSEFWTELGRMGEVSENEEVPMIKGGGESGKRIKGEA